MILGKRKSLQRWVGPLLLLLLAGSLEPSGSTAAASSPPGPRVVRAGAAGIEIEWIAPPLRTRVTETGVAEIEAEGYQQLQQPGLPHLPFTSTVIALPIDAVPRLRVLSTDEAVEPLSAPLAVAPRPAGVIRGQDSQAIGGDFTAANPAPGDWPSTPATLEGMGIVRGVRLTRLVFYPVIPQGAALRVTHRLRVSVAWETRERHDAAYIDPMVRAVEGIVINPWDVAPSTGPVERSVRHTTALSPTAYIEVESAGIYEVTYEDLDDLGFAGTSLENLRLFHGSDELPIEWVGDANGVFEAGEAIRFYAEPRFSRWTNVDAYRLIADASPGQRMAEVSASTWLLPEGVPWVEQLNEENLIYTPDCFCGSLPSGRDGDRWTWKQLRQPDLTSVSLPVQAAAVDTGQDAELTLWFVSYTDVAADPDHRVDAALNGAPLGRVEWNGKAAITATLPITAGILHNGQNTLALTLPGIPGVSVEETWLDAFALRHARDSWEAAGNLVSFGSYTTTRQAYTVALAGSAPYQAYDITNPLYAYSLFDFEPGGGIITLGDPPAGGPRRYTIVAAEGVLQPYRVRAAEDPWAYAGGSAVDGADLLIITHPDFADELDPLVALRQSQGISTTVVSVLGIYDVWGDGRPDPDTIHTFIADAYATWSPRPLFVLLVGDGSYDPRQYRAESLPTFIPPYLADVDPWAGETAADNRYVCVDGSDALPDLLLGRLPVQSAEAAQSLVNKTVQYDTDPSPGGWNADVLLVADDTEDTIDFAASSDTYAAAHVSDPFTVTRFYCQGVSPYLNDCSDQETETIHANLVNDWNQGALLIQFTGHSSWQQWAVSTPSGKPLFHLDDVATLHNGRRLPVMLSMTCFTGAFHRPELTLDEELVTVTNSGAVAAWGPTGLGVGTGHDHLSNGFFHAVFGDKVETIGEAILAGKLELSASGVNLDLLDTFSLLGDPSLRLNQTIVPWDYVFLPLVQRNSDG